MTLYSLKPQFQLLLHPLVLMAHRCGATPNSITIATLLLSLAYALWMVVSSSPLPFLVLPAFLFLRMALNALDGMLAREFQLQSPLGAILNEASDVTADTALYLPFALLPGAGVFHVLAVVFLSMMSEFVGVLGHATGTGRRQEGPLGKSDRAALFGILGLLIGAGIPVLPFVDPILTLGAVLLALTIVRRARGAMALVRVAA